MSKLTRPHWPDEVRLNMIEKSEFYSEPQVYQYGFYDGFQHAQYQTQELTDWKESMMKVHNELDLQGIGNALGLPLGSSIAPQVLPKVKELIEQNRELKEMLRKVHDYLDVIDLPKPSGLTKLLTKYQGHERK